MSNLNSAGFWKPRTPWEEIEFEQYANYYADENGELKHIDEPGFVFINDTNTGLYRPGLEAVKITTIKPKNPLNAIGYRASSGIELSRKNANERYHRNS